MRRIRPYAVTSTLPIGITLDMILGNLDSIGYDTLHKPIADHIGIGRMSLFPNSSNTNCIHANSSNADSCVVYIADMQDIENAVANSKRILSPTVVYAHNPDDAAKLLEKLSYDQQEHLAIVASRRNFDLSYNDLISSVSNYLIKITEFGTSLLQISRSDGTLQDIVNVAESFFGMYIGITDTNNMLVAHSLNTSPSDPVNMSLIKLGYHAKAYADHPKDDHGINDGPKRHSDIIIHDPEPPFPYSLLSYEVAIKGNPVAFIIMACPESEINDGLLGAFSMLSLSCDRLAKRKFRHMQISDLTLHGFLNKLFSEKNLDRIFLQERANRLFIPTHGAFTLACISLNHNFSDQLNYIANEVDRMLSHMHWVHLVDGYVYILFYAESWEEAMEANIRLSELRLSEPYEMYSSDVYSTLKDTYYAYKQIACIKKYIGLVKHYRSLTESGKHANVFAFHDVFCFFWDDPFADSELRGFALDHTRSSIIERDDIAKGTNNLPLLNVYLTLERKATLVGELFHLHRNGVLYRIDKIEKTYHLDLFDYLTRQYLQMCARIKLTADTRCNSLNTSGMPEHTKPGDK